MAIFQRYAKSTLHYGMQASSIALAKSYLAATATSFHKTRKYREMQRDATSVPNSCKIGLILQAVPEVRQSEGFIALNARFAATIADQERSLKSYVLQTHDLNR